MCLVASRMKTNNANELSMYEALSHIDRSFRQILQELEQLQEVGGFKGRVSIKSVKLAVRETRAWTLFEILDVLHQREEDEWTRFGRARSQHEQKEAVTESRRALRAKQTARSKKA